MFHFPHGKFSEIHSESLKQGYLSFGFVVLISTDGRQQMNLVLNRVPLSAANPTWQSACNNSKVTQTGHSLTRPTRTGGIDRQLKLLTDTPEVPSMLQTYSSKMLSFENSTPQVLSQGISPCFYTELFCIGRSVTHKF